MADSRRPIRFLTSLNSLRIAMPQASDPVLKSAERFEDEVLDLVGHGPTAMGKVRESVRRYLSASPRGAGKARARPGGYEGATSPSPATTASTIRPVSRASKRPRGGRLAALHRDGTATRV